MWREPDTHYAVHVRLNSFGILADGWRVFWLKNLSRCAGLVRVSEVACAFSAASNAAFWERISAATAGAEN